MTSVSATQVVPLEMQTALAASIILAVVCTVIEALLAHTFAITIGQNVAPDQQYQEMAMDREAIFQAQSGNKRRRHSMDGPNSAYTLLQAVQSPTDQLHDNMMDQPFRLPVLDTAVFLQTLLSRK
jgi:hypothetical protein